MLKPDAMERFSAYKNKSDNVIVVYDRVKIQAHGDAGIGSPATVKGIFRAGGGQMSQWRDRIFIELLHDNGLETYWLADYVDDETIKFYTDKPKT